MQDRVFQILWYSYKEDVVQILCYCAYVDVSGIYFHQIIFYFPQVSTGGRNMQTFPGSECSLDLWLKTDSPVNKVSSVINPERLKH